MRLVVFDDVPAPCTIAEANGCPRHVVYQVVADRDSLGTGDIDTSNLLSVKTTIMTQIVGSLAFIGEGTLYAVRFLQVTHKADRAVARLREFAAHDRKLTVVIVHENAISPYSVK